jgi:hypothetical protein
MSQLEVADTNDAPDRAACIALTVRRPQAGMRSTGLMTFPLSLSWAAWLIWLSSWSSPAGPTGTGLGTRAPTAFVELG